MQPAPCKMKSKISVKGELVHFEDRNGEIACKADLVIVGETEVL